MGESVVILSTAGLEPFGIEDRELVHCFLPVSGRTFPVGCDIAQGQPDQLGGRIVAREMPESLDDLAQPGIDALDGIGRIDHLADRRRECKERNHAIPGQAPGGHDGRKLLASWPLRESIQFSQCSLGTRGGVNRFDRHRQCLSFLPTGVVQAVADQMHDAGLKRCGRKYCASASPMPAHHDLDDAHGSAAAATHESRRWRDGGVRAPDSLIDFLRTL